MDVIWNTVLLSLLSLMMLTDHHTDKNAQDSLLPLWYWRIGWFSHMLWQELENQIYIMLQVHCLIAVVLMWITQINCGGRRPSKKFCPKPYSIGSKSCKLHVVCLNGEGQEQVVCTGAKLVNLLALSYWHDMWAGHPQGDPVPFISCHRCSHFWMW